MSGEKTRVSIPEEKLKNVVGGISMAWICIKCRRTVTQREISGKNQCPFCGATFENSGSPAPVGPLTGTANPAGSNPVGSNPAGSTPAGSNPAGSNPVGLANPASSAPLPPPTGL